MHPYPYHTFLGYGHVVGLTVFFRFNSMIPSLLNQLEQTTDTDQMSFCMCQGCVH